jgi:predicted nucleic acid-binding protein
MPLYLDSDAVVKRYIDEGDGGTAIMDEIFSDPASWGGLSSSEWLMPEVTSALAKKLREGDIGPRQFSALLATFQAEVGAVVTFVALEPGYVEAASGLISTYADHRFHAGDALHLHTAEMLNRDIGAGEPFVFVTSDKRLALVAAQRGLHTFNPATQTLAILQAVFGR